MHCQTKTIPNYQNIKKFQLHGTVTTFKVTFNQQKMSLQILYKYLGLQIIFNMLKNKF
jgi:hypothetical protein